MGGITVTGLLLLFSYLGPVLGQDDISCAPEKAEACLTGRATQYHGVRSEYSENSEETDALRALCLSQIRPDKTGTCFDQNTKLCTATDVKLIQDQWGTLNKNITDMCLKECPEMFEISKCKNITDTRELKFGLFETFCSSFNDSLRCVKGLMPTCKLGIMFYGDLLEPNIMQYWRYICNSGCHNIDETVTVIGKCANHLGSYTTKESLCQGHNLFKTCVAQATEVCDEMMKIVRFKYRKYDIVDKACMTTTSTTTQSTTTTTTTTTTTAATSTVMSTESNGAEMRTADDCLEGVDTSQFAVQGQIHTDHILLFLQIESCIHNISSDASMQELIKAELGPEFAEFHHLVKVHGWSVLKDSMTQCKTSKEGSRGCSGHRYGLLQCNSGHYSATASGLLLLITAGILLV